MAAMPFSPCSPSGPCDDTTVTILQQIFGGIIQVLVTGADPNTATGPDNILATLFNFFNSGILVVGSIIVSYIAVMGAINTANDGEAMGKAWSTVWTPVRIVAGGAVLLPSASGYSFIQMLVLMISLWGIGFANGIYELGMVSGVLKPDGIASSSYKTGTYYGMRDFAKNYLAVAYCRLATNTIYADDTGNPDIGIAGGADKVVKTEFRQDSTFYVKDNNKNTNLGGGMPICGTVTFSAPLALAAPPAGTVADPTETALSNFRIALATAKINATVAMMVDIDNWVKTMPKDMSQPDWQNVSSQKLNQIVKIHEKTVADAILNQATGGTETGITNGVKNFAQSMTKGGWALAGGWYQRVGLLRNKLSTITGEAVGSVGTPTLQGLPDDQRAQLLKQSLVMVQETIAKKAEEADASGTPGPVKAEDLVTLVPKDARSGVDVGTLDADMSTKVTLMVNDMMKSATDVVVGSGAGSGVDAVSRMKMTGDLLSTFNGVVWTTSFALKTAITAARVVAGTVGSVSFMGNKVDLTGVTNAMWDWLQTVPVSILDNISSYLSPLAFYFGVFLPSLPYTLFIITVVGWVLGVLQATIAAPLWAIMHMRPSQTFVGSEAQGYLLLMALFVRPALAVIGLFAAMLVADPIVKFISTAFFEMRGAVAASTGWAGVIAQYSQFFWWLGAFGALLLPVLYTIFGLPQMLPDQVLKWLNVGVEDLGATASAASSHQAMLPGARTVGGAGGHIRTGGTPRIRKRPGGGGGGGGGGDGGGGGGGALPGPGAGTKGSSSRGAQPVNAGNQGVLPAPKSD